MTRTLTTSISVLDAIRASNAYKHGRRLRMINRLRRIGRTYRGNSSAFLDDSVAVQKWHTALIWMVDHGSFAGSCLHPHMEVVALETMLKLAKTMVKAMVKVTMTKVSS